MKSIEPVHKEQIEALVAEEGLSPVVLEKDIHATDLLTSVFGAPYPGVQLVFGGGTSLSKCFKLINRMSEDIDVKFQPSDFTDGFKVSRGACKLLGQSVVSRAEELDFVVIEHTKHNSGRTQQIRLQYSSVFEGLAILRPELKLELFNSPTTGTPELRDFQYIIDQKQVRGRAPCVPSSQTLVEKVISLLRRYEESVIRGTQFDHRLLRHIYDVHAILDTNPSFERDHVLELIAFDIEERNWKVSSESFLRILEIIERDEELPSDYEKLVDSLVVRRRVGFEEGFASFSTAARTIARLLE